jgi:hypothetical protein
MCGRLRNFCVEIELLFTSSSPAPTGFSIPLISKEGGGEVKGRGPIAVSLKCFSLFFNRLDAQLRDNEVGVNRVCTI